MTTTIKSTPVSADTPATSPPTTSTRATIQLAPLLTLDTSAHITAYITSASAPLNTLIGWFYLPPSLTDDPGFTPDLGPPRRPTAPPAKWIIQGQPSLHPPSVHACCAPTSLLPTSHTHDHDHYTGDDDGPSFFDLLLRPPGAPLTCGYVVRNVFRYPGDNLVLTREYPDYVTRAPAGTPAAAAAGEVTFEFDCAVMHDGNAESKEDGEEEADKVYVPLAALADKVGADWVCCEGRLVVKRVPLVARVAAVAGSAAGREE